MVKRVKEGGCLREMIGGKKGFKAACFDTRMKLFSRDVPQTELIYWLTWPLFLSGSNHKYYVWLDLQG